ncbi:hypothetical protein OCC_08944 [Thermococcus litoralis DSM 5473]|uniref:Uncharacterized protein n=1 Tax=Thermococcus litoralis (strain ATCC 51850 / DSM 5473 / JCM 8560 / NS-C) TaxID=523849 RepID=H3ZKB3_THELN|nr:hypothetical protein OCC_08944 [Thermococcus litoralis DSM 5473]
MTLIFAFVAFHEKKALSKAAKLERWTIHLRVFFFQLFGSLAGSVQFTIILCLGMRSSLLVGEAFVILTWKISHREIRSI